MDVLLTLLGATSFGLLLTLHTSLVWTLWRMGRRARALLGLVAPPAGLVFALQAGLRYRALAWLSSLCLHLGVRWLTR